MGRVAGATNGAWAALAPHLTAAPELPVPATVAVPTPKAVEATPELRAAALAWRSGMPSCIPSWKVQAVTKATAHGVVPRAAGGGADRGKDWGTLIHGLLEHALRGARDPERLSRLADWLTVDEPELRDLIPLALDTVERVMSSEVWARAMAAGERHTEVPSAVRVDGEDGVPMVLQGVIDLVYARSGGD